MTEKETRKQFLRRRRTELFREQGGKCFWCDVEMEPTRPIGRSRPTPLNMCTLDHLFDRHHPMRRVNQNGVKRYVACCHFCNQMRGFLTDSLARDKPTPMEQVAP